MAQKEQPTANRNYKDTVFRMLFSDRQNLLSLYNAVSGSHYDDPEMLEIVTLENAIYMGMKNDLAFIIGTDLFLYEHQSTYNPNMPLRDLFYISSEYQKLVDHKSLYSSTLLKIPAPQFIVFYNGTEKKKDHWLNHLSESFENLSSEPKLELPSPDVSHHVSYEVRRTASGTNELCYRVDYRGAPVIETSRAGLDMENRVWVMSLGERDLEQHG